MSAVDPLRTFKPRHRPTSGETVAPREAPRGWHCPDGEAGATEDRIGGCRVRRARDLGAGWTRVRFVLGHRGRSRTVLRVLRAAFLRPPCWSLACLRTVERPWARGFARNGTANERKWSARNRHRVGCEALSVQPAFAFICVHLRFHFLTSSMKLTRARVIAGGTLLVGVRGPLVPELACRLGGGVASLEVCMAPVGHSGVIGDN
jgi:hypothetical protein